MKNSTACLTIIIIFVSAFLMLDCSGSSSPTGYNQVATKEFDSGTMAPNAQFSHVFTTAKVVPYYCKFHGAPGGVGMAGTITVQAGGTPSRNTVNMVNMTFSPAALTIDVGDTVVWVNGSGLVHTATSDN